ncbi:PD-(D/E)XK nuclease-like domain-containing protein [Agrobacterium rosae]|uniref:PD-(D/E)XK nuclease-like domain-containing protein n=1 Tax=Agrobacterium rosae TaxID=1972867 RepID=UPI0019D32800|nr:PD-(D/E)XK nuclease-like domain-containing protein [Agrobacterium rosae]MBN7804856.1 PD-(D/E)XK nuclease-like domain-containing protein [Agrobacterium rosae]
MGKIIDKDKFEHITTPMDAILKRVKPVKGEVQYDGGVIAGPGAYRGVPIERYHHDRDLFDGPAVSKSIIKEILPVHGGSPKQFWGRWNWNKDRLDPKDPTEALIFGKAAHCLLLGDEVFDENFIVRPEKYQDEKGALKAWNNNATVCRNYMTEQKDKRLMVLTSKQMEIIRLMRADAATYPLVQQGILNGRVERTLAAKDPETGIWLKVRPDAMPNADGVFADLKTIGSFDEDFMQRQIFDAGYYLQAAMTRMVCRLLNIPFETFVLVYVLNDDIPDTAHVEMNDDSVLLPGGEELPSELDAGEAMIRWALRKIRKCLDENHWPGREPFQSGERKITMLPYQKSKITRFLNGIEGDVPPPSDEQEAA